MVKTEPKKKRLNKELLKDRWQTFSIILALAAVVGITPTTLKKAALQTNTSIQNAITFRETSFSAIRGGMQLIATGTVKIDGTLVNVDVRGYVGVDNDDMWAFVTNGHTEMYEAIWSDSWRTFHYYPAVGKEPIHINNLTWYARRPDEETDYSGLLK